MLPKIVQGFLLTTVMSTGLYAHAQVYCEPPSIDVTLGDAELRTDQNFTCSYNSRICPIVYADADNDATRDAGEVVYRGVEVELTNDTETVVIYTESTDNGENACFAPLTDGETYRVRILNGSGTNWPSPNINTTGYDPSFPNIQEYSITTTSGTQLAEFGFSPGGITFNVPTTVTLPQVDVSNSDQDSSVVITPITVEDTRDAITDWSLTATVDDFVSVDTQSTIPVANAFENENGSITVTNGLANGISAGNRYTITGTTDPFTVMTGTNTNGTGLFSIDSTITLTIPPFTPAKSYNSVITYTLTN